MQPVCSKNTPSKSQHCSPLLNTINYEANMQQRGLCGSLCTIEKSAESRWRKLEKRLKIKQIHVLELLGSQCIYDYRWAIRVLWMLISCELWTALKNMVFTNKKTSILVRLYSADYSGPLAHPGRSLAQLDRASAHSTRSAVQPVLAADQHTC